MSENIESLVGDLKAAFGGDFGESKPTISNLQEAVEVSLTERQDARRQIIPDRGRPGNGGNLRRAMHAPPPKAKQGVRLRDKRAHEKRLAHAEKGYRKDIESELAKAERDKGDRALQDFLAAFSGGDRSSRSEKPVPSDDVRDLIKGLRDLPRDKKAVSPEERARGAKKLHDIEHGEADSALKLLKKLVRGEPEDEPTPMPRKKQEPESQPERRRVRHPAPHGRAGHRPAPHGHAGGASNPEQPMTGLAHGGAGKADHNPFHNNSHLGLGPGTPPGYKPSPSEGPGGRNSKGQRYHRERGCWSCHCPPGGGGDIECTCHAEGKGETCPTGKTKRVHIDRAYHNAYNDMYHKWRDAHRPRSNRVTHAKHYMYRTHAPEAGMR